MFARDRDVVVYEPAILERVSWSAQTLFADASASLDAAGTLLTVNGVDLALLGVDAGAVVRLETLGVCEVVERVDGQRLRVSKLRGSVDDAIVPFGGGGWSGLATCVTFAPQIGVVHRTLLRALDVLPGEAPADGGPSGVDGVAPVYASQILNSAELVEPEALGALHLVLAGAAALAAPGSSLWVRAEHYRKLFAHARAAVGAAIDLDGDGQPELLRRVNAMRLTRG
jgi:hypothetical protein